MGRTRRGAHADSPFGEQCPPLPQAKNIQNKTPDRWGAHAGPRPPRHAPAYTTLKHASTYLVHRGSIGRTRYSRTDPPREGPRRPRASQSSPAPPASSPPQSPPEDAPPAARDARACGVSYPRPWHCLRRPPLRRGARQRVAPASRPARVLPRASHIPLQVPNVQFKAVP